MRVRTFVLLLVLVGLLVYLNSLFNGFVGDDYLQIVNNTKVHSLSHVGDFFRGSTYESGGADLVAGIFYRPVMLLCFSVLYHFFGVNPLPYHLFQVLLHITNGVLLFWFLRQFFRDFGAFVLVLVFLVHPINNEAVVYSANLQETLFFFFGMGGMLVLQRFPVGQFRFGYLGLSPRGIAASRIQRWSWIPLPLSSRRAPIVRPFAGMTTIMTLFLFSLLSKESGVLFVFMGVVYCWLFRRERTKVVAIGGGVVFLFYLFLRFFVARMYLAQGSIAPIYQASLVERLVNSPVVFWYYLKTFFFPVFISSNQFWIVRGLTWWGFYFPLLVLGLSLFGIVWLGWWFYRKRKKEFGVYCFFAVWFWVGMGLHLQVIPLDATVADRWFYFPMVGVLGVLSFLVRVLFGQLMRLISLPQGIAAALLTMCLAMTLGVRTFVRNFDWRDDLTLLGRDIGVTPKNFVLDNAYGTALITDGQFEKARSYVLSSVRVHAYYANLNNLAIILVSEKDYTGAKKYLQEAVSQSRNYMVYENYSSFLLVYDDLSEAKRFTQRALKVFPGNGKLWLNLAKGDYLLGDKKSAILAARKADGLLGSEESGLVYLRLRDGKSVRVLRK